MLVAAMEALAEQSPALKDADKGLLPDVIHVREISVHIAKAVIRQAVKDGLAQAEDIPYKPGDDDNKDDDDGLLDAWIREQMWDPKYREFRRVESHSASRHAKGLLGTASSQRMGGI